MLPFIIGDILSIMGVKLPWLSVDIYMWGTIMYWIGLFVREAVMISKIINTKYSNRIN
jgi:hypothetical protein